MNMGANLKEAENHQLYEEQEYENDDKIQWFIRNNVKDAQIEEFLENGGKNKDCCYSSILQSGH